MAVDEALRRLLAGSGLVFVATSSTTSAVQRPAQDHANPTAVQHDPLRVQAAAPQVGDDVVRAYTGIGLVERLDDDFDIRPEDLAAAAILAQPVQCS